MADLVSSRLIAIAAVSAFLTAVTGCNNVEEMNEVLPESYESDQPVLHSRSSGICAISAFRMDKEITADELDEGFTNWESSQISRSLHDTSVIWRVINASPACWTPEIQQETQSERLQEYLDQEVQFSYRSGSALLLVKDTSRMLVWVIAG